MTASILSQLAPGIRLFDRSLRRERVVRNVEPRGTIVFLEFHNLATGGIERIPFPSNEIESRFEIVNENAFNFRAEAEIIRQLAEAHRIRHAYLFNPLFTTETSLIDLLPHQLAAVYGVPAFDGDPARPGMVDMPRLRFLLADDAGAGKTIMAGLLIREMLLRRLATRILVVSPAGLVGNWRRELDILFRLRFRVLSGGNFTEDFNPFTDSRSDLSIISIDTLWREKARNAYLTATPYDLVIFDEAHKLSASYATDLTLLKTNRYEMAELIARQGRHLLLMTATPHMGKDDPYYLLWQLLEPDLLSTRAAFDGLSSRQRRRYLLRRMKEEMVSFEGSPIFPPRTSETVNYPLRQGESQEQDLYDRVTLYCELHFDRARENNRSAAGLAMSILQRRLASSTWAVFKSLERREAKLTALIDLIAADPSAEAELDRSQHGLPDESIRDQKTGDEEETIDGREESEIEDEALAGATDARTLNELIAERDEVRKLVLLARKVYDLKDESKFERLWEALDKFPDEKVLIFTEFRDTLEFLRDRLQGKGLTGQIAEIHGGMDYKKRDEQAAFFEKDARVMVATDAAGEGINLQFCWLLVNYDIPWNPARLEQRMGRVHRYKQTHDVLLLNMVSKDTREGRVLKVLLDKIQTIREQLGRDKVFDIIGRQLTNKPLADIIFEAVVEGKEAEAQAELAGLDKERAQAILDAQERKVETTEVRRLLEALRRQKETAEERRMMPAHIRRFFQLAAPRVGVTIRGDIDGVFAIGGPEPGNELPPSVARELGRNPEALQDRLTFDRDQARPGLGREPRAVYLHPGESVFEAVVALFLDAFENEAGRGGVFYDPDATEASIFFLARTLIVRDPATGETVDPETTEERIVGLRRTAGGRFEIVPAHLLLTLWPHETSRPWPQHAVTAAERLAGTPGSAGDTAPAEAWLLEHVAAPALEKLRAAENGRVPERVEQLRRSFNLRRSELLDQRRTLKEAVAKGIPAATTKLRQCEAELGALEARLDAAESELRTAPDRLRLGLPRILVCALVLPLSPEEAEERHLIESEKIALAEVIRRETAEGALEIKDVSDPALKAGYDLTVTRADRSKRYIEVKGRTGRQAVELTENEWRQAANHPDKYWLYVVYDCQATPDLYRVPDPFHRLLARHTGAVRINAGEILAAAQEIIN